MSNPNVEDLPKSFDKDMKAHVDNFRACIKESPEMVLFMFFISLTFVFVADMCTFKQEILFTA